ncbi:MAG: hypothetical protein GXO07_00675 [Crenarchaeota archaeon]|nr:hypothetical protein [Thermoproteota archaeon]
MAKDFLRQIVNPTLLEFEIPVQILTEIRKKLEVAENKFNFSAFGGDPKNLAKFLRSPMWREVVELFKAANAKAAVIKILERAKEAYKDDEEIVKAIEEALKELESGEEEKKINIMEEIKEKIEEAVGDLAEVKISEDKVLVEGDRIEARVEERGKVYVVKLEVRGTYEAASIEEVKELLKKAKELASKLSPP